jgi:hypothetical protein
MLIFFPLRSGYLRGAGVVESMMEEVEGKKLKRLVEISKNVIPKDAVAA